MLFPPQGLVAAALQPYALISLLLTPDVTAASQTINAAPTASTITAANALSFTGTIGQIALPAITPAANGAGITLTSLNFTQGAIANVADSEAITVRHIVMTFAAGAALETGVLTQTAIDITLANQAANAANNQATGIKITGGTLAGGASAYQRGIDITMAAATDTAVNIVTGTLATLGAVTLSAAAATDGQTNDAPLFTLRNYYDSDPTAGVTSTAWDLSLLHDMTAGGAAPASSGIFKINSVTVLTLTQTNGTPSATFPGVVAFGTGLAMNANGTILGSNGNYDFYVLQTAVGQVPIVGAVVDTDPYWGLGGSKEFKFRYGGTANLGGTVSYSNKAEGHVGSLNIKTARQVVALTGAQASTTINIPSGAMLLGALFNVDTAVVTSGATNTWDADYTGGSTTNLEAAGALGAQNTKGGKLIAPVIASAETNIEFDAPGAETFSSGAIEVVAFYIDTTALANA